MSRVGLRSPRGNEAEPCGRARRRQSLRGIKRGIRGQSSFAAHFFFAAVVVAAAAVLECRAVEWALLVGAIGFVLTAELFRSALTAVVRGLEVESRNRLGSALEIAAGAALLANATAGLVGGIVLVRRVLEFVG